MYLRRLQLTIGALVLVVSLLTGVRATAVIGGSPDSTSQYTTVLLRSDRGSCTGSLIGPRWVLTAAHCVVGASYLDFVAVDAISGSTLWRSTGIQFYLNGYDTSTSANDISLVELREPITGPYAALGDTNEVLALEELGGSAIASGFGRTSAGGSSSSVPLQVRIQLVPRNVCRGAWSYFAPYSPNFICVAPSLSSTVCSGDSGGPLFIEVGGVRKIAGVTSFGSRECGANFSVFTRVSSFLGWISNISGIGIGSSTPVTVAPTVPAGSQVVVFPAVPPLLPVDVPPLYPTVSDRGRPVLPKFSTTRAFQLVTEQFGRKCTIDVDAEVSLRGKRVEVFFSKTAKTPAFRRILDEFGDMQIVVSKSCWAVLRTGVFVQLEGSVTRFRALL